MKFKTRGERLFDIANVVFMIFILVVMLYPFLHVFSISISSSEAIAGGKVTFYPIGFDLEGYQLVFTNNSILSAYRNTILYTFVATVLTLVFCSLAAYPLSRKDFYGRTTITFYLCLALFISGGTIPNYLLARSLSIIDTMWPLILFPMFNMWNIVILRTNFQQLPEEIVESAKLDGANDWQILFRMIIPMSKPIFATLALFTAVSQWNSYFGPMLYLNTPNKFPLQLVLRRILSAQIDSPEYQMMLFQMGSAAASGFLEKMQMAAVIVTIGPIILAYPFAQKYLVKGTLVGSLKS